MVHLYNKDMTNFEILASNDRYFTFWGKAAHASAFPEKGLDVFNAVQKVLTDGAMIIAGLGYSLVIEPHFIKKAHGEYRGR